MVGCCSFVAIVVGRCYCWQADGVSPKPVKYSGGNVIMHFTMNVPSQVFDTHYKHGMFC